MKSMTLADLRLTCPLTQRKPLPSREPKMVANPTRELRAAMMMSTNHAVVTIFPDRAQILEFDAVHSSSSEIHAHGHPTAQHASGLQTTHEFFEHVCDAIDPIRELLVTGTRSALSDFARYACQHRPATAARILGYEVVGQPSQSELIALARQFFIREDKQVAAEGAGTDERHSRMSSPDRWPQASWHLAGPPRCSFASR
jgi:hypothetical protein